MGFLSLHKSRSFFATLRFSRRKRKKRVFCSLCICRYNHFYYRNSGFLSFKASVLTFEIQVQFYMALFLHQTLAINSFHGHFQTYMKIKLNSFNGKYSRPCIARPPYLQEFAQKQ